MAATRLPYETNRQIGGPAAPSVTVSTNTALSGATKYGNVYVTGGATLTLNSGSSLTVTGTLVVDNGASLVMNHATLAAYQLSVGGTLTSSNAGDVLTVSNSLLYGTASVAGTLTLSAGGSHSATGTIGGAGTLSVGLGVTLNVTGPVTMNVAQLSGAGSIAFGANTVTVSSSVAWAFGSYTASGTLVLSGTVTLTMGASYTLGFTAVTVSGSAAIATITLSGSVTLTVSAGVAVSGSGSPYLLYLIVPAGSVLAGASTMTWTVPGYVNLSSGSTYSGNQVITGTSVSVFWIDPRFTRGTGAAGTVTKPLGTISGTGIFMGAPTIQSTSATHLVIPQFTNITAGGVGLPTGTATGSNCGWDWAANESVYLVPTVAGVYYLGVHDSTGLTFGVFVYCYIGSTIGGPPWLNRSTLYSVLSDSVNDVLGDTVQPYSSVASAGTLEYQGDNGWWWF